MRSADVTVIAFQGARQRLGQRHRRPPSSRSPPWSRPPTAAAALARRRPRTRAELVAGDVGRGLGRRPGARPRSRSSTTSPPRSARRSDRPTPSERVLYGFVNHDVTTTYLGSSTGLRLRHVQPTGHFGCTGKDADLTNSAWVGGATRDFTDVDPAAMADDLATRLAWGERRVDLPAGRYDTVLPPIGRRRPDDRRLLVRRGARRPRGPVGSRSPGGGTRIGEQIVTRGRDACLSDPAYAGLECAPFVVAAAPRATAASSTTASPLGRTDWIRDGRLELADRRPGTPPSSTGAADHPGDRQPGPRASTAPPAARWTSSPASSDGLLLTCLWYIREVDPQTLLLTGLTRDGVYLRRGRRDHRAR